MSQAKKRALKSAKEARGGGQFLPFPKHMLQSSDIAKLSPYAAKLLLDIASQWRLGQNGDASIAFENVMKTRGWRSKSTLYKALRELRASGLIVLTRQGGLHQCSLYALGWLAIDECGGKLDVRATTRPLKYWTAPLKPLKIKVPSSPVAPKASENLVLGTPAVPEG